MTSRSLGTTAAAVLWLGGGLYGAGAYGHRYYVYRGFDPPHAPRGTPVGRDVTATFYSRALRHRRSYLVHLPAGYDVGAAHGSRYPVLYLLHGTPGWPRQFLDIARAGVALDVLVARREVRPMLLVMPDGRDGTYRSDTEWADSARGRYESLVLETVRAVDRRFATRPGRAFRAIAGNSEGAYGAVNIALRHLAAFSIASSWSGYFEQRREGPFAGATTGRLTANSPAAYVGGLGARLRRLAFHLYLFTGLADPDRAQSDVFAAGLRSAGGDVRYIEYAGRHSWRLWRDETPGTLRYVDRWFAAGQRSSRVGKVR